MTIGSISRCASVLIAFAATACADAAAPRSVIPFDATTQPILSATSSVSGAPGAEDVLVTVQLRNPDTKPRQFTRLALCTVTPRLYTSPARTGTPAYSPEFAPGGCKSPSRVDTIAGGTTLNLAVAVHPVQFLMVAPFIKALDAGRYYVSARVGVIELTAGTDVIPAGEVVLATP